MKATSAYPSPAAIKVSSPPRQVPVDHLPSNDVFETDQAFFQRYTEISAIGLFGGQPAYSAFDSRRKKPVLLRCFRDPWESDALEIAIKFGRLKSPCALPIKDISQRPTETVLVSNLFDFSIEEWACSESVTAGTVERFARQIGDWMMEWKEQYGTEVALENDSIRIGRTKTGKPFCRVIGGNPQVSPGEAVSAMRRVLGSLLLRGQQSGSTGAARDIAVQFTDTSSIRELNVDHNTWLGWILSDDESDRPASVGEWLPGQDEVYLREAREKKPAHHELSPNSPWQKLQP